MKLGLSSEFRKAIDLLIDSTLLTDSKSVPFIDHNIYILLCQSLLLRYSNDALISIFIEFNCM